MKKITMEEAKKLLNDKINHYTGEGDHKQEAEKKAFLELNNYLKENNIEIEHNDEEIEMTPENVEKFHNEVFVKHFWKDEVERREKMGKNYNEYYNKGNDCDVCKNQYVCGEYGDATGCSRYDEGLECEFVKVDEEE